jgi:hypothetical protein
MKRLPSLCLSPLLATVLLLNASTSGQVDAPEPPTPPPDALPGHIAEARFTSTFEVVAIDAPKRRITLREEGEEPATYEVDKDVRNLEQVKVGDRVTVDQYVGTAITLLPPGELRDRDASGIDRSKPGEKPGGVAIRTRTRIERVSSIFPDTKEFLTRSAKGKLTTWKVKDAKALEKFKSGDRLLLTSMSALAINVTPAPATTTSPTTAPAGATTAPAPATPPPAAPSAAPGS